MADAAHRVVVWPTGGIGSIATRAIQRRPNLDPIDVWVQLSSSDLPLTIPQHAFA
jgi:hypothetical protein